MTTTTDLERRYVVLTQQGLPLVSRPYDYLAEQLGISVGQTLAMTRDMLDRGIIRRIAAVPNHYKLGYTFNGMTTWDVQDELAVEYGQKVGELPYVSHCYLRPRHLPSWHCNLFAMIHATNKKQLEQYRLRLHALLGPVLQHQHGNSHDMLVSKRILKKTGLRLKQQKLTG